MYKTRRSARELALNILFQIDVTHFSLEEALITATENAGAEADVLDYARMLANGTIENIAEIDGVTQGLSHDWPIDRQPAVDRNILRMAIYEMGFAQSAPPAVVIDEAVELAKKYSTADSGKFVNGLLAEYLRRHQEELEERVVDGKDSGRDADSQDDQG